MIYTIRLVLYVVPKVLFSYFRAMHYKKTLHKLSVREQARRTHQFTSEVGRGMVRATGSTVNVTGLENMPMDTPVLIVGNHQSNFDIPVILGYLNKPVGFISKVEVKKIPIVPLWMDLMHCVPIDRSNRRQAIEAMKQGVDYLKSGFSLVIFPEGTRSKGGPMNPFKQGSLRLAIDSQVPIVPIAINGTHEIMETAVKDFGPAHVEVKVMPPIGIEQINNMEPKLLIEEIQRIINDNLHPKYQIQKL